MPGQINLSRAAIHWRDWQQLAAVPWGVWMHLLTSQDPLEFRGNLGVGIKAQDRISLR